MHILHQETSGNHEITIYETTELDGEKGRFRVLQFSHQAIQGALDLLDPGRILFEYPRAMIHLMESNNPAFDSVFLIGHGIGTIPGHFADKRFTVAELDAHVVELSRRYFGYKGDNVFVGDGRMLLEQQAKAAYDVILLDAFTEKGTPQHLISSEFFSITREKLDAQGSVILNLIGKGDNDRQLSAIRTTLGEAYSYTKAFRLQPERARETHNVILIGRNKPIEFQLRHMAGFKEFEPRPGHIIMDV